MTDAAFAMELYAEPIIFKYLLKYLNVHNLVLL